MLQMEEVILAFTVFTLFGREIETLTSTQNHGTFLRCYGPHLSVLAIVVLCFVYCVCSCSSCLSCISIGPIGNAFSVCSCLYSFLLFASCSLSPSSRNQPQTKSTTTFSRSPFAFSPLNGWLIHTRKPPCTTGLSSTSSTKGTSCRSSGCWTSCPSCRSCPIYLGQMSRQPTTVAPMAITAIASQR